MKKAPHVVIAEAIEDLLAIPDGEKGIAELIHHHRAPFEAAQRQGRLLRQTLHRQRAAAVRRIVEHIPAVLKERRTLPSDLLSWIRGEQPPPCFLPPDDLLALRWAVGDLAPATPRPPKAPTAPRPLTVEVRQRLISNALGLLDDVGISEGLIRDRLVLEATEEIDREIAWLRKDVAKKYHKAYTVLCTHLPAPMLLIQPWRWLTDGSVPLPCFIPDDDLAALRAAACGPRDVQEV